MRWISLLGVLVIFAAVVGCTAGVKELGPAEEDKSETIDQNMIQESMKMGGYGGQGPNYAGGQGGATTGLQDKDAKVETKGKTPPPK